MTDQQPVSADGFQPAPGEGITQLTVKHTASDKVGQQLISVSIDATHSFPVPVLLTDALQPCDELAGWVKEETNARLEASIAEARAKNPTAAPAPPVAAAAGVPGASPLAHGAPAAPPSADGWAVGTKPENKGTFRYVTSNVLSADDFKAKIAAELPALGIDPSLVTVWDNRVGPRGIEAGNASWMIAAVKANEGTPLAQAAGTRSLCYVDFNADGSVSVKLSKDGDQAVKALEMARSLASVGAAPVMPPQAPPPTEAPEPDLPF